MTKTAQPVTILVVEDDDNIRNIVAFLLEDEGYQVLLASDGKIALSILETANPDLIISDVMMPLIDGYELYERVRQKIGYSQIPFIFLTAKSQRADVRRGMELGADDYLTKPFEAEELISAVKVRLARAAETRDAIQEASANLQERTIRTLSHEFRTPLSLVVGYTELLEGAGQQMSEDDFQTILQGLYDGSQRLTRLVEDFLLLNHLTSGSFAREKQQASHKTTSPGHVIKEIVAGFGSQAAARNVEIIVRPEPAKLAIGVDPWHLEEIVRRIVDNAIKFSKDQEGKVELVTRREGEYWVLAVADDGIGIPQEALSWIFDAFRQVDREKMEQQGSGIGLTIVRGLAEAYGGRVTVESTLGEGSVFAVYLPLATS